VSDRPPPADEPPAEPKPKKKRKKARAPTADERATAKPRWMLLFGLAPWALARTVQNEESSLHDGYARPPFAATFPGGDVELEHLVAAFQAGDYAAVRRDAPRLVKSTEDDDVRAAARDLLRRIDPDPIARWMMGGAGLLLASLAGWYWMHAHGGP
jgi:hypothetical protein